MTPDRLTRLLNNPELLATISFEELKTLALEYPYADNLHLLLAIKAQQLNHPDLEQLLHRATLHAVDRKHFFAITHKIPAFTATVPESVPVYAEQAAEQGPESAASLPFSEWYAGFNLVPARPSRRPKTAHHPRKVDPPAEEVVDTEASGDPGAEYPATPVTVTEQTQAMPEDPAPEAHSSSATAKPIAQQLAAESLRPRSSTKSVPLAHLLAMQGNIKAAVAMLEQMMLDNPEKSAYFAAEIEKIKQH